MKGMVACEVSACDEIMITELLFSGIFNETSSEEAAGLLTCLIFDENSSGDKLMIKHDGLNKYYNRLMDQAKRLY